MMAPQDKGIWGEISWSPLVIKLGKCQYVSPPDVPSVTYLSPSFISSPPRSFFLLRGKVFTCVNLQSRIIALLGTPKFSEEEEEENIVT